MAVEQVLIELATIGGEEAMANTMRIAVDDRCPDWGDAVDEVLGAPTDG